MFQIVDRGAFEPQPKARWSDPDLWKVVTPPVVAIGDEEIAPATGFVTDGASIPWWARWKIDPWGRNGVPAVIHDWLLANPGGRAKWEIDLIFFGLLKASGSPDLEATLMFLAVRTRPLKRTARGGA